VPALKASSTLRPANALVRASTIVVDAARRRSAGRLPAAAGGKERAVGGAFHRDFQIGFIEHDPRILAAHLELTILHRPRCNAGRSDLLAGDNGGK